MGRDKATFYRIPRYAKLAARKALKLRASLPPSKRFGLSPAQARKLGIMSGVQRAKYILNNKYISLTQLMSVAAFYSRFRKKRTVRAEGAIGLWGGRKFGQYAIRITRRDG